MCKSSRAGRVRVDPSRALPWFESIPTKIGPSGCSREMPVSEEAMIAADMIGFMELVV